ncbi:MAG TPA: thiamine diphosphokinase [Clostridiaceae bacterium]|nr:thiamine diphosphokinase [Clostridiaceae bacterium]
MTGIVICSGTIKDYTYYQKYFESTSSMLVISVDGGAHHARQLGFKVDVLLGDFDSISMEDYRFYENAGVKIIRYPQAKDETDTQLAVNYAIDNGCTSIYILGGFGNRLDHSLANIFLLKKMTDRGVKGYIIDENNEITLIDKFIRLNKQENTKVTLLPLTEKVEGITTKGLLYPLENATLEIGPSRGLSNEFIEDVAEVSIKKGLLLVIKARD